jgi:uncharacterized membrane protein
MNDAKSRRTQSPKERYRRILSYGQNTDRTIFFADAVMAIALTVLVLEIRIPQVSANHLSDLPQALVEKDLNGVIAYVVAFVLIGVNWLTHHRKFTVIERYDPGLQILNLGYLFFIALLPLPVSIVAEYGLVPISVELYALFIAAPFLFQLLIWVHAWRAKLFNPVVDLGMYRTIRRSHYSVIIVFSLSIFVSVLFGPITAMVSWFGVLPAGIIVGRWRSRAERVAETSRTTAANGSRR